VFDKKKQESLFLYRIQQDFKTAAVIFIENTLVQQMAINVHFLRISDTILQVDQRLQVKLSLTKKSNHYITLPHFVTLKDEAT
jgi:hypothetical protein